jgi:Novel STAND NTPase 1
LRIGSTSCDGFEAHGGKPGADVGGSCSSPALRASARPWLAAALAEHVVASGAALHYGGSGGAGGAKALAAIADARSATAPTLIVLDELHLHERPIAALVEAVDAIETRPVLLVGLFDDDEGRPQLAELVDRVDARGDGRRRLRPLGLEGVEAIARSYVGDVDELPAESMLRASGGVPARVHEVVSDWARDEAKPRLAAAAEWLAAGKSQQAAGLEFAHNVIALKLGRIYDTRDGVDRSGSCPYKGLAAFDESDAAYFYGRERLVGELAARTVGMGLLGVVGPSGSGKSSVVLAGLLPSLAAGLLPGSERWGHAILRPGEHPLDALETALRDRESAERLVLVVDQFEEVFTGADDEPVRAAFIDRLVELARDPERAVVVVTIRADYTGHCTSYPELAEVLAANLVLVAPMAPDELRRAIELPARRVGLRVESSLRDALVEEVGEEPGALPLLSTALVELWQGREDGWLRFQAHARTGGVHGAVSRLAETSYEQLSQPEREAAKTVLLRLVGEGEGESAVRRRVPISEFDVDRDATIASVLTRLTTDRLLTRDDGMIELAHEALLREWPRLRGWLEEDVTGRRLRAHLTQSAVQWADRDRDAGDLYRGARLSATLDWAQTHDRDLNELEREFLASSRQGSEHEAERQRRSNRRLRGLLIGTAIFLVAALIAGVLALIQRGHARDAQSAAEAQALRSDAERLGTLATSEPQLDRAYLLGVAGVELEDLPQTRGDLLTVLQNTRALLRVRQLSRSGIGGLDASPDGRLFATGDAAGVVRFTDLRTGRAVGVPVRVRGEVTMNGMAFSPDGHTLAVATAASDRATLYFVDVRSRQARRIGSWHSVQAAIGPHRFTHLAFSPDGQRIAVAVATANRAAPVPRLPAPHLARRSDRARGLAAAAPAASRTERGPGRLHVTGRAGDIRTAGVDLPVGCEARADRAALPEGWSVLGLAGRAPARRRRQQRERRQPARLAGNPRPAHGYTTRPSGPSGSGLDRCRRVHVERCEHRRRVVRQRRARLGCRLRPDHPDLQQARHWPECGGGRQHGVVRRSGRERGGVGRRGLPKARSDVPVEVDGRLVQHGALPGIQPPGLPDGGDDRRRRVPSRECWAGRSAAGPAGRDAASEERAARGGAGVPPRREDAGYRRSQRQRHLLGRPHAIDRANPRVPGPRLVGGSEPGRQALGGRDENRREPELARRSARARYGSGVAPARGRDRRGRPHLQP